MTEHQSDAVDVLLINIRRPRVAAGQTSLFSVQAISENNVGKLSIRENAAICEANAAPNAKVAFIPIMKETENKSFTFILDMCARMIKPDAKQTAPPNVLDVEMRESEIAYPGVLNEWPYTVKCVTS